VDRRSYAGATGATGATWATGVTGVADSGRAIDERLVEEGDYTAVCVANDQIALGLVHTLDDHGIAMPTAVSTLGFDELLEAAHFSPPIISIR